MRAQSTGTILRWLWSELETVEHEACDPSQQAVARDYSIGHWVCPLHFGDHALARIETTHMHLEAAAQDHRVIVLPPDHSHKPIDAAVAEALASFGVTADDTVRSMLEKLGEHDQHFSHHLD